MNRIVAICGMVLLISGCSRDIDSGVYSNEEVDFSSQVYDGVIISVRRVTVNSQDNTIGAIAGGVLGAAAGQAMGGGRGRILMSTLGAVGGATAGSVTQKAMSKQTAIEYVVKINGEMRRIVQGKDVIYQPGQKVLVSLGGGRPRIISVR